MVLWAWAKLCSSVLITRRSQVQILPPLLERPWNQGLSSFWQAVRPVASRRASYAGRGARPGAFGRESMNGSPETSSTSVMDGTWALGPAALTSPGVRRSLAPHTTSRGRESNAAGDSLHVRARARSGGARIGCSSGRRSVELPQRVRQGGRTADAGAAAGASTDRGRPGRESCAVHGPGALRSRKPDRRERRRHLLSEGRLESPRRQRRSVGLLLHGPGTTTRPPAEGRRRGNRRGPMAARAGRLSAAAAAARPSGCRPGRGRTRTTPTGSPPPRRPRARAR